ncbi:phosphoadenylyl-sulfate reductase [Mycolicibacterium sp. 120270]|uniref:phosphoadenylyl-sulfate reductase n=1 Tax=Mycolicibacterium sp. 120270 TaxID=3090600 RepID=UPI00299D1813|nr:phosphoadenylyl-sulfate reductase [Mycolicibacterium sp. 120270]MDX1881966.1 phosphoadenylyl-sulfate reductase [Mycolicibacterium sp. 120270]
MSETDLQRLAERGAAELEGASAEELLRWTDENFGGSYVVASNMQDAVLVSMAAKVRPGVDILFLDTGYHFVETIGTRDAVEAVYDVNIVNVTPESSVAKQDQLFGKDLFARDASECCRMRKVEPLGKALQGYSAWVTGIRRVEAPTRANAPLISWDQAFNLVKINPIAAWTDDEMQAYIEANDILVNPLVFEGYPSIGCAPCTSKPVEGADPRSGRWAGSSKTECGLHAS